MLNCCLLGVRELQADEVEHLGSKRRHEILDELAELHLAVRLPCHVDHVDDFVATYAEDRHRLRNINHRFVAQQPDISEPETPSTSFIGY